MKTIENLIEWFKENGMEDLTFVLNEDGLHIATSGKIDNESYSLYEDEMPVTNFIINEYVEWFKNNIDTDVTVFNYKDEVRFNTYTDKYNNNVNVLNNTIQLMPIFDFGATEENPSKLFKFNVWKRSNIITLRHDGIDYIINPNLFSGWEYDEHTTKRLCEYIKMDFDSLISNLPYIECKVQNDTVDTVLVQQGGDYHGKDMGDYISVEIEIGVLSSRAYYYHNGAMLLQ